MKNFPPPKPTNAPHEAMPLHLARVQSGFASPVDDYREHGLDLHSLMVQHPAATYFARAAGNALVGRGIFDGDLLVVDRALEAMQGDIVIAALEGELCCKIFDKQHRRLLSTNPAFAPIPLPEDSELVIEGVVTGSIRLHRHF
jgi:DNA polymerase V